MAKTFSIHSTLNTFKCNGMRQHKEWKKNLIKATTFGAVGSQYFIFIILIWMKTQKFYQNFAFAEESFDLLREKMEKMCEISIWNSEMCRLSSPLMIESSKERDCEAKKAIPTCHFWSRFFWWPAILSIPMKSTIFWRANASTAVSV